MDRQGSCRGEQPCVYMLVPLFPDVLWRILLRSEKCKLLPSLQMLVSLPMLSWLTSAPGRPRLEPGLLPPSCTVPNSSCPPLPHLPSCPTQTTHSLHCHRTYQQLPRAVPRYGTPPFMTTCLSESVYSPISGHGGEATRRLIETAHAPKPSHVCLSYQTHRQTSPVLLQSQTHCEWGVSSLT